MAKKAFFLSFRNPILLLVFLIPGSVKPLSKLGVKFFPPDCQTFYTNAIHSAMASREKGDKRLDFLQLMVNCHNDEEFLQSNEVEKRKNRGLTEDEILAQGLLFFLAGYESTANTLSFLGYNLAMNPQVQDRLIEEIDEVFEKNKILSYDSIKEMPYLDMCVCETLRLNPPAIRFDRVCNESCTIDGVFIPKDMHIIIPVYAFHMNPQVYPNPHTFDPERFTTEAKQARNPYYYMPFGTGPRSCIAMRLAMTELKIAAAAILLKLKFVRCEETEVPLNIHKAMMKPVNGIKIRVEERLEKP